MQKKKFVLSKKKYKTYKKEDGNNTSYQYFILYSYRDKFKQLRYSSCIINLNNQIKSNSDLKVIKKKILLRDADLKDTLSERFISYQAAQNLPIEDKFKCLDLSILNLKLINTKTNKG